MKSCNDFIIKAHFAEIVHFTSFVWPCVTSLNLEDGVQGLATVGYGPNEIELPINGCKDINDLYHSFF